MNKEELQKLVFESLGGVSMCWSERPKGIFDSTKVKEYGDKIMEAIDSLLSSHVAGLPTDEEVQDEIVKRDYARREHEIGFEEGVDWLRSRLNEGGGWISVKDRLPEKNVKVLVALQYATKFEVQTSYISNHGIFDHFMQDIITHWQPLPTPPATSNKQTK